MVNPVDRPSTAQFSSTSPPTPALYNAMNSLWCLFHDGGTASNTPQFLTMLAHAIKTVMAQFTTPPTDAASLAIYNDLKKPMFEYQGKTISLYDLCNQSVVGTMINDMGADFLQILNTLGSGNGGLISDIDSWYATYGKGQKPTPPQDLQNEYSHLINNLQNLSIDKVGSDQYNADLQTVVTALMNIYGTLNDASSLDGYGQLLMNFITCPLTSDGSTSLYSLCSAITKAGGVSKDQTDATTLGTCLLNPSQLSPPFDSSRSVYDELENWVSPILNKWEFSQGN